MATPRDVLRIAAGELGYYAPDDPQPGSKYGRYWAEKMNEPWLAGSSTSIWWCMLFVSWCLDQAGVSSPGFPSYNCDLTVSKAGGTILADKRAAQPGDVAIFDWNMADKHCNHTGFIELNKGSYAQTIEGNTSPGTAGSQSAGNGVWRRTRSWSVIRYVIRPTYTSQSKEEDVVTQDDINKIAAATRDAILQNNWIDGEGRPTAVGGNIYNAINTGADSSAKTLAAMQKNDRGQSGVGDAVWCQPIGDGSEASEQPAWARLYDIWAATQAMKATIDGQSAAIDALSKSLGADPSEIGGIVQQAVKDRLAALRITVSEGASNE